MYVPDCKGEDWRNQLYWAVEETFLASNFYHFWETVIIFYGWFRCSDEWGRQAFTLDNLTRLLGQGKTIDNFFLFVYGKNFQMICIRINLFVAYVTADRWLQNENTYSMMYHMSCTKFFWTIRRHECIIYCTLMQNCYIERFNKQINKNRLWMKYTHSIFLNSNNSDLFIYQKYIVFK